MNGAKIANFKAARTAVLAAHHDVDLIRLNLLFGSDRKPFDEVDFDIDEVGSQHVLGAIATLEMAKTQLKLAAYQYEKEARNAGKTV